MRPVGVIRGTMAPLPRAQVDTDQIIPKQFLKRIERTGFGQFLFYDWAHGPSGDIEPDFVLNRPEYRKAKVLVAGADFGIGSSREHAPWALSDWGFEAVIAPSFGDIFRNNSHKNGLLAVELTQSAIASLMSLAEGDPETTVVIDLEHQQVTAPGVDERFTIEPSTRDALLKGLDEIAMTLLADDAISRFEADRPSWRPRITRS